ncbi:hypothetical protein [Metabacillus sp. Hm71]|uniref:hypothetical protein n=1 Tax=Metabacillus sp. Hm71 TaxID=3450743 RepID=UPI003F42E8A8
MKVPRKLFFISMSISFLMSIVFIIFDIQAIGWFLMLLSVAFFILGTRKEIASPKEIKKSFIDEILKYQDKHEIKFDKTYFSESNKMNISFSHDEELIYIFNNSPSLSVKVIDYKDIAESHLVENGDTITKTSRTSQISGVLVGGMLAGTGGAIVGALSGKKKSSSAIRDLELKIVVNDLNNPVITYPIKDTELPLVKNSPTYKQLYDRGYEIHKIISLIIKQQEEKQNSIN